MLLYSVVFEQHAVVPVEESLPPETNAVRFFVLATNKPLQLQFWRQSNYFFSTQVVFSIMIYRFPAV